MQPRVSRHHFSVLEKASFKLKPSSKSKVNRELDVLIEKQAGVRVREETGERRETKIQRFR
jgi:hypothetical protein